jgi:membrane-bound lytic murein transglycosylase D
LTEIQLLLLSPPRTWAGIFCALLAIGSLASGCGPKPASTSGRHPSPPAPASGQAPAERSPSMTQILSGPESSSPNQGTPTAPAAEGAVVAEADEAAGPPNEQPAEEWLDTAAEALDQASQKIDGDPAGYEQAMADAHHALWRAQTTLAMKPDSFHALHPIYERLMADLREMATPAGTPRGEAVVELGASPAELADAKPAVPVDPARYEMPIDPDNPLTAKYLALFQQGARRQHIVDAFRRSSQYRKMILEEINNAGLPEELWVVPIIESGYKVNAYSRARAVGLWQFMTTTGRHYGLTVNEWVDERRDPLKSTRAAMAYLKDLYLWFNNWDFALAAYNRGEFGIQRDIERSRIVDFMEMAELGLTHRETENHVPQIQAAAIIAKDPEKYGFHLEDDEVEMDLVEIDYTVDLSVAATCAGVSEQTLRDLNPELRKWVTPVLSHTYPRYTLKLPEGTGDRYREEIQKVADRTPRRQVQYSVRRGDTLSKVAQRFGVSTQDLREWNRLRSNKLRRGQKLMVVPPKGWKASSEPALAAASAQGSSADSAQGGTAGEGTTIHTVRRGDTLYAIALTYNTTVTSLRELNQIGRKGKIYPGQKLKVPTSD